MTPPDAAQPLPPPGAPPSSATESPDGPPTGRGRGAVVSVVAVLVAFVAGLALGALVVAGDGTDDSGEIELAEEDLDARAADLACAIVAAAPDAGELELRDMFEEDPAMMWRLHGVAVLGQMAAEGDSSYRRLGRAAEGIRMALVMFDEEEYAIRHRDAVTACSRFAE